MNRRDARTYVIASIEAGNANRGEFNIDAIVSELFEIDEDLATIDFDTYWAVIAKHAVSPGPQGILDRLNAYKGDDPWNDVIFLLDEYDEDATIIRDPTCKSQVFVTTDGTVFEYVAQGDSPGWRIA